MKVIQLVKYYYPNPGGMERFVKILSERMSTIQTMHVLVYTNHSKKNTETSLEVVNKQLSVVRKKVRLFFKSQPLEFLFADLDNFIKESDIVHLHYPYPNIEFYLFRNIRQLKDKKLIITWHANINKSRWSWAERFLSIITYYLLSRADRIIVTSPQLSSESHLLQKFNSKISTIPISTDLTISKASKKFPKDRKFKILFVGKLRKYKGIDVLLKSLVGLDINCTIVGSGEEMTYLSDLSIKLNLKKFVRFEGDVSDEALKHLYSSHDLFVLPSINEAEAFGIVQLEAMSFGLPVINTKLNSGVPHVSLNDFSGLTVMPNEIQELNLALKYLSTNEEAYERFSSNALKRVEFFSIDNLINSYLSEYIK